MAEAILADVEASGIYQIRNLVNGKVYIGSAVCIRKRWNVHRYGFSNGKHPNRHLMAAWAKYGQVSFRFEVIENCDAPDLIEREQFWLDRIQPDYNIATRAGSCLGVRHSEEAKRACSERHKGNKYCVGRVMSESSRQKISASNLGKRKGIPRPAHVVAATAAAHRGMKRSKETRMRISASRKGKTLAEPRSAGYRAKMSAIHKGRAKSADHMAALQAGRAARIYTEEQRLHLSELTKAQYESGVRKREKSEEHKNKIGQFYAKLTDDQVREIRQLRLQGVPGTELAKRYNSNAGTISAICKRKRYRWVA